jgi:hypothetical protein
MSHNTKGPIGKYDNKCPTRNEKKWTNQRGSGLVVRVRIHKPHDVLTLRSEACLWFQNFDKIQKFDKIQTCRLRVKFSSNLGSPQQIWAENIDIDIRVRVKWLGLGLRV